MFFCDTHREELQEQFNIKELVIKWNLDSFWYVLLIIFYIKNNNSLETLEFHLWVLSLRVSSTKLFFIGKLL